MIQDVIDTIVLFVGSYLFVTSVEKLWGKHAQRFAIGTALLASFLVEKILRIVEAI